MMWQIVTTDATLNASGNLAFDIIPPTLMNLITLELYAFKIVGSAGNYEIRVSDSGGINYIVLESGTFVDGDSIVLTTPAKMTYGGRIRINITGGTASAAVTIVQYLHITKADDD